MKSFQALGKDYRPKKPAPILALFSPAIWLMNRLVYPGKFILMGLFFALPLSLVLFLLIGEIDDRINFAKKELAGNEMLRPLRFLLEDLQRDRGMDYSFANHGAFVSEHALKESKKNIQRDIDRTAVMGMKLRRMFSVDQSWSSFLEKWHNHLKNEGSFTAKEDFKQDTSLIDVFLKLITDVADRSNLILDPDLDSYYLMDSVVSKLPSLTEEIGQARGWGAVVISNKSLKPDDAFYLSDLAGVITKMRESVHYNFQVIFRENSMLRPRLEPVLEQNMQATDAFLTVLREKLLSDREIRIEPQEYWELGTAAITANFRLYDAASKSLDEVLQKRIDKFSSRKTAVLIFTLMMLLIVIYLVAAFYLAMLDMIAVLGEASRRMTSDEIDGSIVLPKTHDEMGRVVEFFAKLADRLRNETKISAKNAARFSGILDISGEAIISIDSDQKIIIFNKQAEIVFGYSAVEVVGQPIDMLMPERFRKRHPGHVNEFAAGGDQARMMSRRSEIFGLKKNGEEFPAEASISKFVIDKELIMTVMLRDISERKKTEEALKVSEKRLRQITDAIPSAVYRYSLDKHGTQKFLFMSRFAETLFGTPSESIVNNFNLVWNLILPEDVEALEQSIKISADTLTPWVREFRIRDARGNLKWLQGHSIPEKSQADGTIIWDGILTDITLRKQAELRLSAQHAVTGVLAESPNFDEAIRKIIQVICENLDWQEGAVWNVDAKADVLRCADIWHKQSDSMKEFIDATRRSTFKRNVGLPGRIWESRKPAWILNVLNDPNFPRAPFAAKAGIHSAFGFPILFEDQIIGVMEFFTTEIRDPDDDLLRMMKAIGAQIGQFIQRQRMGEQLLQSQKMETVGTLTGGIAHDLNNQMTPLRGFIDLLIQNQNLDAESRSFLEEANLAAKRCSGVVQELLNFARPSSYVKKAFALDRILEELRKLLRPIIPANISLEIHCEKNREWLHGNETEIQSVLMNLVVNARDAMATSGGKLSIDARWIDLPAQSGTSGRPDRRYAVISVSDTGGGMTNEIKQRIFEPFFTTKPKGKGTGLGLAMVFKIVKDHHGWVDVSSKVGKGTTFQIYLPATQEKDQDQEKAEPAILSGQGETILFADDEEKLRNLAKVFLERLNYKAIFAANGDEALGLYQTFQSEIAVVIMDMTMPCMPGRKILKRILEINPKARVIVSTGYTSEGSSEELLADGAAGFIQKPYTIRILAEAIHSALPK